MNWLIALIEPGYLFLILPALLLSVWSSLKIRRAYKKYSRVPLESGLTGGLAARMILDKHGLYGVSVECISGTLTDHYDPRKKVLRLSENVFSSASVAAVGVAAHEAGHAIQHAKHYIPMTIRTLIVPVTNLGSTLAFPTAMVGILLSKAELVSLGIILFSMMTLFQLITLPVEFNASHRAICVLQENGYVRNKKELRGVKKVLTAAALTYVAALLTSLLSLVRFVFWTKIFSRD